jgi:hypothetical protein
MIIKRFNEEYELDVDGGEIAEEYAKVILSKYIEDGENTLEHVYNSVIRGDELEEDQAFMIKDAMIDYLKNLLSDAEEVQNIVDKYNL